MAADARARSRSAIALGWCVLALLVFGCRAEDTERAGSEGAGGTAGAARPRLAWLHGDCLVTKDAEIGPGAPVTAVLLDDPQRVVSLKVMGAADDTHCWPLLADRRAENEAPGAHFYRLAEAEGADGLGIALLDATKIAVNGGRAEADLDGDGKPEHFDSCATTEGVRFLVNGDGAPLWTAYYYLGYDQEPTCPEEPS